ncbi:MAG: hypothetical protein ACXWQE_00210 [Bdellovibrionales bacterium]
MKTFVLQLYGDMRVVVEKRGQYWQAWPQKFVDGKWTDHNGEVIASHEERADAMIGALLFSARLMRKMQGG